MEKPKSHTMHISGIMEEMQTTVGRPLAVEVDRLKAGEVPAVLAIADDVFGVDYISAADLSVGSSGLETLAGVYRGRVVGFVSGGRGSVSAALRVLRSLPSDIRRAERDETLGIIKSVGVARRLHGRGIGSALFSAMEEKIRVQGCSMIAVPAWRDYSGVHLHSILSARGYAPFLTCERYWQEACEAGAFSCRSERCSGTCVCDLVWYKKSLRAVLG